MRQSIGDDETTIAAATAVYRKAKNAPEFFKKELDEKFNIQINLIDGETEAMLTALSG